MGRKTETILTYRVKIKLPTGSNAAQVHEYLREAIGNLCGSFEKEHPLFNLTSEDYTVSLLKKEVNYA